MEHTAPHNREVEQAVLGSVFMNPRSIRTVMDRLDVQDFYIIKHQVIYSAFIYLFDNGIDIDYQTVVDYLETKEEIAKAGGVDYVLQLTESVPSLDSLLYYINIVADKALVRLMMDASQAFIEKGYNATDAGEYLELIEKEIYKISQKRRTNEFVSIKQVTETVLSKIEKAAQQQGSLTGLSTGFKRLNAMTHGLQPTELIIIAARPSIGKSALALNIAKNVASSVYTEANQEPRAPHVAFFSLEMGSDQLLMRLLSAQSHVSQNRLKTGNLTPADWEAVNLSAETLSNLNIVFDDSGTVRVHELRQKCRKLRQDGKLDLVVVDYLQLLSGSDLTKRQNRVIEVSEISRTLKEMARELKIPVIALSQLSRSIETRSDKRPIMADLRESGSIEQDADMILFLYRDEVYNAETVEKNILEIIVSKNRQGSTTSIDDPIKLVFNKENSLFSDYNEPRIQHDLGDI
jgi:replicative DNA helicase